MFGALLTPERLSLTRGCSAALPREAARFGTRAALVHSASLPKARLHPMFDGLTAAGITVQGYASSGEPDFAGLTAALHHLKPFDPDLVIAVGGGATIDLAKAIAALLPATGDLLRHFEIVGAGAPLEAAPLPMIALPTTAGTGAEATKNAVIAFPDHRLKVSLRDDRMIPRLALVDPALTDGCPRSVTLASGFDALTQVIEPYLCARATALTDALCRDAIPRAIPALRRLKEGEDPQARDEMARVSLFGGIALANAGLGAVHGFAGPLGGQLGAAHGALCGRLLPEVLIENRAALGADQSAMAARFGEVDHWLAEGLGAEAGAGFSALRAFADACGLPRLAALGLRSEAFAEAIRAAKSASSMRANPVVLSDAALEAILIRAL